MTAFVEGQLLAFLFESYLQPPCPFCNFGHAGGGPGGACVLRFKHFLA